MSEALNTVNKLTQMSLDIYNKTPQTQFSVKDAEASLRKELNSMIKNESGKIDYFKYQQNKWMIFEIISKTVDLLLPDKVISVLDKFCEVQTVAQGDKIRFKVKKGISRVKNFITKVGAGGNYEVAQLDSGFLDLTAYARGGGILVELERFLDGTDTMEDLYNALMEGLEYHIYQDIQTALKALTSTVPTANYATHAGFDATKMQGLINVIRSYGIPTINCTPAFAGTIVPASGYVSEVAMEEIRNQGYIGRYYGTNVVLLPQSYTDETNATKVIDNQYAYITASTDSKPIKIAFEGQAIMEDVKNADGSMEFQIYKKIAIGTVYKHFFALYVNSSL